MLESRGEMVAFISDDKREKISTVQQVQVCTMCGDVGFSDHLQQCTRCRFRFQHTYCCNSGEGIGTGKWICDWCRLVKVKPGDDVASATCTASSRESGALEYLLKAALTEAVVDAGVQNTSVDGSVLCSSSIDSVKGDDLETNFENPEDAGCSNRESICETDSATARLGNCDPRRNAKLLRSSTKEMKKRRSGLLEHQCGSVQMKRLPSLKGGKSGMACDPPRTFVRRYKSLLDISF